MNNVKSSINNLFNNFLNPKAKQQESQHVSKYSQMLTMCEIFQTVASFLILLVQFFLASNFGTEATNILNTSSYKFIYINTLKYQIVSDVVPIDLSKGETCPPKYLTYYLYQFSGISNVCKIKDSRNSNIYLDLEEDCKDTHSFGKNKLINNILNYNLCFRAVAKFNYIYTFRNYTNRCDDNQLRCGSLNRNIICLDKNDQVNSCPIVEITNGTSNTIKTGYNKLLSLSDKSDQSLFYTNFTTAEKPYISWKIAYQTFNDINFYDYFDNFNMLFNNMQNLTYLKYLAQFDEADLYFSMNPFFKGKQSEYFKLLHAFDLDVFFKWTDVTFSKNIQILYKKIDPINKINFMSTIYTFPTEECIEYLFMNSTINPKAAENNNRGYFSVLSDMNFDFLNYNTQYFYTWSIIEIGMFLLYSFTYRFKIISQQLNEKLKDIDSQTEMVTIVTLKLFYYFSLVMKLIILHNINSSVAEKMSFIREFVNRQCFINYEPEYYGKSSILHMNLDQFLKETSLLNFVIKTNYAIYLSAIEIVNELISFFFISTRYFI